MISAIVMVYRGSKPSEDALRRVVEQLTALNCCSEIIDVKHLEEEDIAKAIVNAGSSANHQEKRPNVVIEFTSGDNRLETVKLLKNYFGISLKEAKDAVDAGHIAVYDDLPIEILTALFDNGVIFTKAPDVYLIENAIYLLNKLFVGNDGLFNLVKYLQEYRNGTRSKMHSAVHAAVDLLYKNKDSIAKSRLNSGLYNVIRAWKERE